MRALVVLYVFSICLPVSAQFEPEVSTSFGDLDPGVVTSITQEFSFATGEEAPTEILVEVDRGSFVVDGLEEGDTIGTLTVDLELLGPFVEGTVYCDVNIDSVGTDEITADVVIVTLDLTLQTLLDLVGIDYPSGVVVFTMTLTDLEDDAGVSVEATDSGALPVNELLSVENTLTFEFESIYKHSPLGGALEVSTTLTSAIGDDAVIEETFEVPLAEFLRGDVDGNGTMMALLDALRLLAFTFGDEEDPPCMAAADCDGDGSVSALVDALYLLAWMFGDGDPPPDPGPEECGLDPNALECLSPPDC